MADAARDTPATLPMRLVAMAVRAGFRVLRQLGPVGASNLAGAVARGIGPLLPVSRVADANLRLALPELDAAARRRVVRGVWDNLGRVMGEFPHLPDLHETASGPGWEIEGEDILRRLKGPAIFVSGHIGNWEMLPPAVATRGPRMASMYRPPDNILVDRMIMALRQRALNAVAPQPGAVDVPMFPKGATGARGALAHLSRGGFLGMLVDQKMNDGIAVDFFGRPAMTAPAMAALALRYRCPVVPGHIQRLGPARFRLVVEAPLPLPETGDRQADILALTRAVNATLERWIRARPDSWLWLHRRWPRPPG